MRKMSYLGSGPSRDIHLSKLAIGGGARPKSSEKKTAPAAATATTTTTTMPKKPKPEDVFYENLTLGLKNTLESVPRICDINFEMRQPCEKSQVVSWEQRHSVYLPEDMKKFYLSTDGFTLQWSYQYAVDDVRRVGLIHFPHLLQITLLRENVEMSNNIASTSASASAATLCSSACSSSSAATAGVMPSHKSAVTLRSANFETKATTADEGGTEGGGTTEATATTSSNAAATSQASKDIWGNPMPILTTKSKIFELNNINDVAKVCLVYESTGTSNPKIYLLELKNFRWQFLAESFSEYLRMSVAHLGLPFWELCFSTFGLPTWTEQLFLLLAPHLLDENEKRRSRIIEPASEHPYNNVDPNIFRVKAKTVVKASTTGKHK